MGYSTKFDGRLTFRRPPTPAEIMFLNNMLGEDCRDHPSWGAQDATYIDLELTEHADALIWSGAEKTYGMIEAVNILTTQMRVEFPGFSFDGGFNAQGDEAGDVWQLIIDVDGIAQKHALPIAGSEPKFLTKEQAALIIADSDINVLLDSEHEIASLRAEDPETLDAYLALQAIAQS